MIHDVKKTINIKKRATMIGSGVVIAVLCLSIIITLLVPSHQKSSNNTDLPTLDDIGEVYFQPTKIENIVENDEKMLYVNNELLLVAAEDATYNAVAALAESIDCKIVGWIEQTGDYQLQFIQNHTQEELQQIATSIKNNHIVRDAHLNCAFEISETKTKENSGFKYGKKWENALQDYEDCSGNSWGLEAINTFSAWNLLGNYKNIVNPVRVGVIDSGFDADHEDLGFAQTFYNKGIEKDRLNHGTHVAGTFAAKANNDEGICGIYPYGDGNLYGVSHDGVFGRTENGPWYMTTISLKISIAELVLRNVKVINSSMGFNHAAWVTEEEWKSRMYFVATNAYVLGDFLNRLLENGYDFVIVNSAGNDSNHEAGIFLNSKFSYWTNAIDREQYPAVFDRIIVVGATNKKFDVLNNSNGGIRVDTYAPGESIYSTVPNNKYSNKYSGSSMAAPHVSGVAAMVWSINNQLTGAQVKQIIRDSDSTRCQSCDMIDAGVAVRKAIDTIGESTGEMVAYGSVLCWVVSANDDNSRIANATVTINNTKTGTIITATTDSEGHFEIFAPAGEYTLSVTAENYKNYTWPDTIVIESKSVNYLNNWVKMTPDSFFPSQYIGKTFSELKQLLGNNYSCHLGDGPLDEGNAYVEFEKVPVIFGFSLPWKTYETIKESSQSIEPFLEEMEPGITIETTESVTLVDNYPYTNLDTYSSLQEKATEIDILDEDLFDRIEIIAGDVIITYWWEWDVPLYSNQPASSVTVDRNDSDS